jgi:uncharacterized protein (DUF1697 family)
VSETEARPRHVALLRGINVGGRNRLPMKDLAMVFTDAGCGDVETYIASGNVLFTAPDELYTRIATVISEAIERSRQLCVAVVTRTGGELAAAAERNPWDNSDTDPKALHVAFLADSPSPESVATLEPNRSPSDDFAVSGREIYLRCPNGMGRSRLTNNYFEARLGTACTVRNWRTVRKLRDLSAAPPSRQ